jgi:hypothetical protein
MTDSLEVVTEGTNHLTNLIDALSSIYDQLYSQDIDIDGLGEAIDGLIFANDKLQDTKIKLEAQRKDLRSAITSKYGDDQWESEKLRRHDLRKLDPTYQAPHPRTKLQ